MRRLPRGRPGIVTTDGPARPALAEDSKALKEIARLMYTMTEQINTNYIVRVAGSSMPVTCSTCHRGNIGPEPFTIQPAGGPPPVQAPPSLEERPQPAMTECPGTLSINRRTSRQSITALSTKEFSPSP